MNLKKIFSDGAINFWDKDSRQRLKPMLSPGNGTVSCTTFNAKGDIFAYAISYDWSKVKEKNIDYDDNHFF